MTDIGEDATLLRSSRCVLTLSTPSPTSSRLGRAALRAAAGAGFFAAVVGAFALVKGWPFVSDWHFQTATANVLGASSADCWWTRYPGYIIPGNNLVVHHAQFLDMCLERCRADMRCTAVEFATIREHAGGLNTPGDCILHSATGLRNSSSIDLKGYRSIDLYVVSSCEGDLRPNASTGMVKAADLRAKRISEHRKQAREAAARLQRAAEKELARARARNEPWVTTATTTTTTTPCVPERTVQQPSVFCFSVMTPGPEVALIESQFKKRASIFACNDFAVISVQSRNLGLDECGRAIWTWTSPKLKPVHLGNLSKPGVTTNSYLNTLTFITAWDMLTYSGAIWKNAWIAKVDPDAVFFPDRLRSHLAPHTGPAQYVLNCLEWGRNPKVYGAVEVFSMPAIAAYKQRTAVCKNMGWHGWGEDFYMQQCMVSLGVAGLKDYRLVGDNRCRGAPCSDKRVAAYHPFKDPGDYWDCWHKSTKAPPEP